MRTYFHTQCLGSLFRLRPHISILIPRLVSFNTLEPKAGLAKGVADGCDVRRAASFKGDIDDGFTKTDAVVGAVVYRFDNVGALAGEDLREIEQGTGAVLQIDPDAQQTAVLDQAALNDLGQQGDRKSV